MSPWFRRDRPAAHHRAQPLVDFAAAAGSRATADDTATWPLPSAHLHALKDTPDLTVDDDLHAYLQAMQFRDDLDVLAGQALRHVIAGKEAAQDNQHPSRRHAFTVLTGRSVEASHIAYAAAQDAHVLTLQLAVWRAAHGLEEHDQLVGHGSDHFVGRAADVNADQPTGA